VVAWLDFFTHHLVPSFRDSHEQVVGLIGRDVLGADRAKYLNTPTIAIYNKRRNLAPRQAVLLNISSGGRALCGTLAAWLATTGRAFGALVL
jgi:DNA primase